VFLAFGETPALRGATLEVTAGEILAVMGPSGSGKSTLLHCLAGILVPASGEIRFDNQRVDTMHEQERGALRRDHFGFVFQFGQLVPELTAEENVALPLLLGGARRTEALHTARDWFERLGLDGIGHRRSGELSGGQAQRVALARGLVANPAVLFVDEPTGSLDSLHSSNASPDPKQLATNKRTPTTGAIFALLTTSGVVRLDVGFLPAADLSRTAGRFML